MKGTNYLLEKQWEMLPARDKSFVIREQGGKTLRNKLEQGEVRDLIKA